MPALDSSLGAMMIGTWVNMMLYMLEIVQVIRVFRNFPKDPMGLKLAVAGAFVVDSVCTMAACATIYIYCVTDWGIEEALAKQYWTFPTYVVCTATTAFIVQSFLVYRFFTLSRNTVLTLVCCVLTLTAYAGGVYCMFALILFPAFADRDKIKVSATLWLVSTTLTDIILAVFMVWKLRSVKSSFKSTQSLLSKLTTTSIQSGAVTSFLATIVLITFLRETTSNIPVAFNFMLGRVYAHTMLYGLTLRRAIRDGSSSGGAHTSGDMNLDTNPAINLSGIQVKRSVQVHDGSAPSPLSSAVKAGYYPPSDKSEYIDSKEAHRQSFPGSPRGNFVVMD